MENDLIGFKYNGPGWYLTDTDTILVIPMESATKEVVWKQRAPGPYWVYVWNRVGIGEIFNRIVNAPTRGDKRGE